MSFALVLDGFCFAPLDHAGRRTFPPGPPRRSGSRPGPAPHKAPAHPVLFMGGFLLAISLAVIGLWQGLGLLLPH